MTGTGQRQGLDARWAFTRCGSVRPGSTPGPNGTGSVSLEPGPAQALLWEVAAAVQSEEYADVWTVFCEFFKNLICVARAAVTQPDSQAACAHYVGDVTMLLFYHVREPLHSFIAIGLFFFALTVFVSPETLVFKEQW